MNASARRAPPTALRVLRRLGLVCAFTLLGGASACVTQNTTTGEMVPRGEQRYPWDQVQERAERLKNGLHKHEVLLLMGSPAELDEQEEVWVYLPERYGIIVPAQALRLQFKDGILIEHGYRPIVLGAQL